MNTIEFIYKELKNFVKAAPLNNLSDLNGIKIYDDPIVAVAKADDPLFLKLKEEGIIGPTYLTPLEWFPEGKAVISYFLPFTKEVRESNRPLIQLPSIPWLYGTTEGDALIDEARKFLIDTVENIGGKAMSPLFDERYGGSDYVRNWSERHTAFISGLGTFGLNTSLITKLGSAGRIGSVIVDLELEATERPYKDIYEYCSRCYACFKRCPVNAIDETGKNHISCEKFVYGFTATVFSPRNGCGKCQTAVPCECKIP